MARVTVEDCVLKVPNRFDLVMLAAQRARDVASGAQLSVDRDNDKNPVVALREIAEETIDLEGLRNNLVQGLQRNVEKDEPEEEGGIRGRDGRPPGRDDPGPGKGCRRRRPQHRRRIPGRAGGGRGRRRGGEIKPRRAPLCRAAGVRRRAPRQGDAG